MIADLILGATFGFGAAVQPGPLQTYLATEALTRGWRRTLPVALAPLLSDGPIIVFVMVALARVPASVMDLLRCAGGLFLLFLAANAYRAWRENAEAPPEAGSAPRSLMKAALVNVLNPNPYLAWSLVLGPLLIDAWHRSPWSGAALVAGFYGTMVIALAALVILFARAADLGTRASRVLLGASVVALAALGAYQVWTGATGVFGP